MHFKLIVLTCYILKMKLFIAQIIGMDIPSAIIVPNLNSKNNIASMG